MPVIRDYQQKTSTPGAIQQAAHTSAEFGGLEGTAMQGLGKSVGDVGEVIAKRVDQQNTSDTTAKLTKAHADLAIDLQKTIRTAEPGDEKPFEDFNKRAEETLGAIGDNANTEGARKFYAEASAKIKGSLANTSAEGQSELAGVKAVQDYTQTINNLSAASLADPTSLQLQRDLHKQSIEQLVESGQLPRDKALKLQTQGDEEITKSSLRGWIQLNPDYAKQKLKSGEFDGVLGADGKIQITGEADQAIRAKEIDQERRVREQERVVKLQQTQTQNKFLQGMADGNLSTKDILNSNLDPFGSGSKEQFLALMKTKNASEEKLKTDPQVMIDLYTRIHLPDGDPKKLVDENDLNGYFGNGISFADLGRLREEMQGKGTEAGKIETDMKKQVLEIAKGKLTKSNPLTGFKDPIGDEQMARYMNYFFDQYKEQRAAGVPSTDLLSPDSPKYLGKNISQYVRTNKQIMADMVPKRVTPAANTLTATPQVQGADAAPGTGPTRFQAPPPPKVEPRQPKESAADYLKRVKKGG